MRGKTEGYWLSRGIGNKMRCLISCEHLFLPISCFCEMTWWIESRPERPCPSCCVGSLRRQALAQLLGPGALGEAEAQLQHKVLSSVRFVKNVTFWHFRLDMFFCFLTLREAAIARMLFFFFPVCTVLARCWIPFFAEIRPDIQQSVIEFTSAIAYLQNVPRLPGAAEPFFSQRISTWALSFLSS